MVAQIDRMARMLDECCRPIKLLQGAMWCSRSAFVCEAVVELEAIAPEVVASMLEQSSGVYSISEDGTQAISGGSGKVRWDAAERPTGLTIVHPQNMSCIHSAAAAVVKMADVFTCLSQPCKLYACVRNAVDRREYPTTALTSPSCLLLRTQRARHARPA